MTNLGLPFLPVSISSLQEDDLFMGSDARLVRAVMWMQDAAWRSEVPGSISSTYAAIAHITRLTEDEVGKHYEALTAGWELREDGRLHHLRLAALAETIDDRFGDQLDTLTEGIAVAIQGADVFELMPPERVKKVGKKRASRRWPPGFSPDGESLAKLISLGYVTQDQRDWLLGSFKDYAHSKALTSPNWQASLRTYAGSSITARSFQAHYGFYPGAQAAPSPGVVSSIVSAPSAPGAPETPRQVMDRLQGRSGMPAPARTPPRTFSEQTGADNRALMFGAAAAPISQPLHRCADGTYSDS